MTGTAGGGPAGGDRPEMHRGDQAPPGTPGTGEAICPRCSGSGRWKSEECPDCEGSGTIVQGIGGA